MAPPVVLQDNTGKTGALLSLPSESEVTLHIMLIKSDRHLVSGAAELFLLAS